VRADLTGQVALVVGADTPVGAGLARVLAANGAQLASGSADDARHAFARIDMVVNCAPYAASDTESDDAFATAARLLRETGALMRAQGSGRIVTVIGTGANVVRRNEGRHSAAMAGIASLTRTAALELAADGVRVNAVAAGPGADAIAHIPLGRAPTPEVIANAALFLLAPASSYVTGHVLVVDGGFSAGYVRNF
jgi:NAD(P)-dependent dehydrogenase (short-subunit alcohol dehydrogenase family)